METEAEDIPAQDAPKPKRTRKKKAEVEADTKSEPVEAAPPKPKRTRRKKADETAETVQAVEKTAAEQPAAKPAATAKTGTANDTGSDGNAKPKRGWWQRTFGE